jgi:hypothetical protein
MPLANCNPATMLLVNRRKLKPLYRLKEQTGHQAETTIRINNPAWVWIWKDLPPDGFELQSHWPKHLRNSNSKKTAPALPQRKL